MLVAHHAIAVPPVWLHGVVLVIVVLSACELLLWLGSYGFRLREFASLRANLLLALLCALSAGFCATYELEFYGVLAPRLWVSYLALGVFLLRASHEVVALYRGCTYSPHRFDSLHLAAANKGCDYGTMSLEEGNSNGSASHQSSQSVPMGAALIHTESIFASLKDSFARLRSGETPTGGSSSSSSSKLTLTRHGSACYDIYVN